jgi:hypothetical protein
MGFETDVEILWRFKKMGYRIREYPIAGNIRRAQNLNYLIPRACLFL